MSILYICGGCPGAGKTHYIKSILEEDSQVRISIEDIRMELVPENQQLYSKETLVFNTFLERIIEALEDDYDVYADATNLTKQARYKILSRIPKSCYDEVHMLWFNVDKSTCVAQNELRKGSRTYLDPKDLKILFYSIEEPEQNEGFDSIEKIIPQNAFMR